MSDHRLKEAEYIGCEEQLMTCFEGMLTDGPSAGVKFIQVENGGGLSARILPDRGLDLYQVRFAGQNMNYLSPAGARSARLYDGREDHFLRNFYVGQLTTGGLQNLGPERRVYGEMQGLHGRFDNTEASGVFCRRFVTEDGRAGLEVGGTIREGRIFGENLKTERLYRFTEGTDTITLTDTVTNEGFLPRQFALLYHINFGYPLLEEGTHLTLDSEEVKPRTDEAAKYLNTWNAIEAPSAPYPERCYFHRLRRDADGMCEYQLYNEKRKIGAAVRFSGEVLPYFCEWKMLGKGEYVLGLEPSNTFMDGPAPGEEGCGAPVLQPGESRTYMVEFRYFR